MMTQNTNLDENIDGAKNFKSCKYRVMQILKEHDLEGYIKDEVKELGGDEAKAKHNKDMIKYKRIIADSIKDNFIPQVFSKNTPNEIFNTLTSVCEWKNINRIMTLRN